MFKKMKESGKMHTLTKLWAQIAFSFLPALFNFLSLNF